MKIRRHALKIQPLIPREREKQRVGLAAVIALGDVYIIMNVSVVWGVVDVVNGKPAVGFGPDVNARAGTVYSSNPATQSFTSSSEALERNR